MVPGAKCLAINYSKKFPASARFPRVWSTATDAVEAMSRILTDFATAAVNTEQHQFVF